MKADFSTLIKTGKGGVFRSHIAVPDKMLDSAAHAGVRVGKVGLQGARDRNAFLKSAAKSLRFPEYFGHNWDAFYDCLIDLEHEKGEGILVLLREASGFARAEPEEFAAAVDTLQDAAEFWDDDGKMLLVIVELEAPVLAPELPEISVQPG
ncbi:MAG TPA: barstar family protein [Burkholderiales bacterium]